MKFVRKFLPCVFSTLLVIPFGLNLHADVPGTRTNSPKTTESSKSPKLAPSATAISPVVTATGLISLSVDGLGTNNVAGGIIQVQKPAGATVRGAYMAAASTGFRGRTLADGDVMIDGAGVTWSSTVASSISSYNSFADVTSLVKAKIDAAPAGRVDFTITEVGTYGIDGEILAVIFDDPGQTTSNTIVLLFGAQNIAGDTFHIGLGAPIDKSDPKLMLDLSLGISYGYQPSGQYSLVDVNGIRMTTSAGGQDDGAAEDGALLTVGGLDDTNDNPANPYQDDSFGPRYDDELYNLLPFVNDGDTSIEVYTQNPSNDDNIFFAALNLSSATAVVGEGIILTPPSATNPINTQHTVTAKVQDDNGNPVVGRTVNFSIVSGPHAGLTGSGSTDGTGQTAFTYTGTVVGTDVIEASFVDNNGNTKTSNQVTKTWESSTAIKLASFNAKAGKNRKIKLNWKTATEVDNAGFNLYRSDSADGTYTKINSSLIPAKGNAVSGARYKFVDAPSSRGTYYYKLEDVDPNGDSTQHGPVVVNNAGKKVKKSKK